AQEPGRIVRPLRVQGPEDGVAARHQRSGHAGSEVVEPLAHPRVQDGVLLVAWPWHLRPDDSVLDGCDVPGRAVLRPLDGPGRAAGVEQLDGAAGDRSGVVEGHDADAGVARGETGPALVLLGAPGVLAVVV